MAVDTQRFTLLRRLHGVDVSDIDLQKVEGKGWGIVTTEDLATEEEDEARSLMTIPHELVLNTTTVETYAKESRNFRDLYEAIGPKIRVTDSMCCYFFWLNWLVRGKKSFRPAGTTIGNSFLMSHFSQLSGARMSEHC